MARGARSTPLKKGPGGRLASGRSKTGDPQCSAAMSAWVRARHGGAAVAAEVFKILGMCRAKARALKMSADHAIAGNTAKSQVYARRAERGLSGAARDRLAAEKRATLATTRAARAAAAAPAPKAAGRGTPERLHLAKVKREHLASKHAEREAPARLEAARHGGPAAKGLSDRSKEILAQGRRARAGEAFRPDYEAHTMRMRVKRRVEERARRGRIARAAAEMAPKAEPGFSLEQGSAQGKAGFKVADLGRGRTGTLFDINKKDLRGQTSMFDPERGVRTAESNPRAKRLRRAGAATDYDAAMLQQRRNERAKALAELRKQRNSVKADLEHYTAEHAARNPHDQSRADRLDELAAVERQIARTRGAKVQVAKLSPGPKSVGKLSPEFELAKAKARLATRARTAEKLKALKGEHDEHAHPELHGKPHTPYMLDTKHIHFDPERFQYKLGAQGAHGVTDSLSDVTEFNHDLAGIVSVWRDPANGRTFVVNGHHRVDLAKRLDAGKIKVQYLDSPDAVHARGEGALMNIAEGRGTALDAAKFFRDHRMTPEGARAHGVSLKEHTAKQGLAMSHLAEPIFKRVAHGEISPNRAAIIGAAGLSHDEQTDLMRTLDKPKYRNINDGTVRNLADTFKRAGAVKVKEKTLFGDDEHAESLGVHRATLEDKIKRKFNEDHKLFGLVSKSKSAAALAERADSNIDTEKAGDVAHEARTLHHFFDQLKQYGGLSRSLNEGAEKLHAGRKMDEVFREHYKEAREHVKRELEAGGLG